MDLPPPDAASQALLLVQAGRAEEALEAITAVLAREDVALADKPALRYAAAVAHHALGNHSRMGGAADACLAAARRLDSPGWMATAHGLRAMAEILLDRVDVAMRHLALGEREVARTEDPFAEDPEVKAIVDAAVAVSDELGAEPLGEIAGPFTRAKAGNGTSENRGGESTVGNLVLGWVFYVALGGIAQLVLGPANVAALGDTMPSFAAQVGVCWVFWMIMWPNAFGNRPDGPGLGAMAARTAITLVLAVATFALYYWVLAGAVFHEPPAAEGATVNGSALVAIDWLIIIALWYVAAAESWGLPRMRTAETAESPVPAS